MGSLIGLGFSAYLTYLELLVIDAICQWCVASAVLMTLLLCVNAGRAFRYAGTDVVLSQDETPSLDPAVKPGS